MGDDTDWSALEHAYGPATEVPAVLAQIGADKAKAVERLANRVAHQGWLSAEVALAVVPHLFRLVGVTKGKTRAALLILLADLACAGDHEHFLGTGLGRGNPVLEMLDEATGAVRDAVVEGVPGLVDQLGDRSALVRGAMGLLVAVAGGPREALEARLPRENNAQARSDLLIGLGWLAGGDAGLPEVLVTDRAHRRPEVRAGASIGSAYAAALDDAVGQGLLDVVSDCPVVKSSAWAGGDAANHAIQCLRHAATASGSMGWVVRAFHRVDDTKRQDLGASLVKQVFRERIEVLGTGSAPLRAPNATEPPPLDSLTKAQRDALELLVQFDTGWGYGSDQRYWLEKFGFPRCPPQLKRYLGHAEPPPDVLASAFVWHEHTDSFRELVPKVCIGNASASLQALAEAYARTLEPAPLVDAARLILRVRPVPSFPARLELATRLLLEGGADVVPLLEAELAAFAESGHPSYWSARCLRLVANHFTAACAAALRQLSPEATLPPDAVDRQSVREHLPKYSQDMRRWLRAAEA